MFRAGPPDPVPPGRPSRRGAWCLVPLMKSASGCLLSLLVALAARPALGGDAVAWSLKAFGTLGAIGTDTDRLGFRRDHTQDTAATRDFGADIDSRLGVQIDADFGNTLHAAVQWVARNHAGNFFEQNLEWAFLRWRPRDDLDLRVGRLGADAFLISDYRNVGYAYPWMRPPHEFYAPLFPYHFDGVDIVGRYGLGEGVLRLKGYAGYNLTEVQPSNAPVFGLESLLFGGSLAYESGDWRARVGYTQARPVNDLLEAPTLQPLLGALEDPLVNAFWPGASTLVERFSIRNQPVHYTSVGLAYDGGSWPIQAEAAYVDSNIIPLPSMVTAYLSVGRRFGNVTLYSLLGIAESLNRREQLPELPPAIREAADDQINGNNVDQKSVSFGARWDVYENVALKAQWSHFWIEDNGDLFWLNPTLPAGGGVEVNVWSFGVDFVF
jgi:hypothetical protein